MEKNDTKQLGAVLVFKPGLTKEEVEARLLQIADVIDPDYYCAKTPTIHEFSTKYGSGPVWYIP